MLAGKSPACRPRRVFTIRRTSTTPAALDLSPASAARKATTSFEKGIQVLLNLTHRGACGCDPETGDGAGVLIQIPHKFFARECEKLGFTLPKAGTLRRRHDVPSRSRSTSACSAKEFSSASCAKKA